MRTFEVTLPDGRAFLVEVPDDALNAASNAAPNAAPSAAPNAAPSAAPNAAPGAGVQPSEPGLLERNLRNAARGAGLDLRAGVKGVTGIVDFATLPVKAGLSALGVETGSLTDLAERGLDIVGIPRPETPAERITSAGVEALVPGGALIKGAKFLKTAASPLVKRIGTSLAEQPVRQLAGAAAGGASGQLAAEVGEGPGVQLGASLVGGALGARLVPSSVESRLTAEALAAKNRLADQGIKTRDLPGEQIQQIQDAVAKQTGGQTQRAQRISETQRAFIAAREQERIAAGGLFTRIREGQVGKAFIDTKSVRQFSSEARRTLSEVDGFDLAAMPGIRKRLSELDELTKPKGRTPQASETNAIDFDMLERWRRRLISTQATTPEQRLARTRLRKQYDDFTRDQFVNDMVEGDPSAVVAWKTAIERWASFKTRFDSEPILRKLQDLEATPEQVRKLLFNASAVGAKPEAGRIVRKLNETLGPNSRAMDALRAEVIFDLSKPLRAEPPDLKAFVANFRNFFENNATLQRELFGRVADRELLDAVAAASAVSRRAGVAIIEESAPISTIIMNRLLQYGVGNQLARGTSRLNTVRDVVEFLRRKSTGGIAERSILQEITGVDPRLPLITSPVAATVQFSAGDRQESPES